MNNAMAIAAALLLETRFAERLSGRRTNDVDIIIPAHLELQIDADRQFWTAIEATNRELEPQGLFISHIFPEAEVVLTPEWERHLLAVDGPWEKLRIKRPRMLDLILSKMGRGDAADVADVRTMLVLERAVTGRLITPSEIAAAARTARVPQVYREIFPRARDRILAVADEVSRTTGAR
jgi:hypothetical protein